MAHKLLVGGYCLYFKTVGMCMATCTPEVSVPSRGITFFSLVTIVAAYIRGEPKKKLTLTADALGHQTQGTLVGNCPQFPQLSGDNSHQGVYSSFPA